MRKFAALLLLLLGALLLSACAEAYSGRLILNGTHALADGEVLDGELLISDGQVTLAAGSRVTGSIYLLRGTLAIEGEVGGDVSAIGGNLSVGPDARIGGSLNVGGEPDISPQAWIGGGVTRGVGFPGELEPGTPVRSTDNRLLWLLPEALMLATLAYLAVRYLPRPVGRVDRAIGRHWLVAGAMGVLVMIVVPALLVMMAFTIVLIPVTMLGIVLWLAAIAYGWVGFGVVLGRWVERAARRRLRPPLAAFAGTALFWLLFNAVQLAPLPLVGEVLVIGSACVGLGAVLLTRLGLQEFVPATDYAGE